MALDLFGDLIAHSLDAKFDQRLPLGQALQFAWTDVTFRAVLFQLRTLLRHLVVVDAVALCRGNRWRSSMCGVGGSEGMASAPKDRIC